ncbi:peroxisomal biogenesis factor 11 [Xylogone sp. PMI_703]|nr:peroxisomal biogenesis factor 11 [Xylogone sp. PMI_703]
MTFNHAVRFLTDAGGLERLLRMLQAISQIIAATTMVKAEILFWGGLRLQFALARRYFRFFKFLSLFSLAFQAFNSKTGLDALLDVGKTSCMGMYLLMESSTMLDAMGAWKTTWAARCMIEANKFWFYSLVFSIIRNVLELLKSERPKTKSTSTAVKEKKGKVSPPVVVANKTKQRILLRRIIADACDLLIPGSVTGWIPVSMVISGYATVVSTFLTSIDIWEGLR